MLYPVQFYRTFSLFYDMFYYILTNFNFAVFKMRAEDATQTLLKFTGVWQGQKLHLMTNSLAVEMKVTAQHCPVRDAVSCATENG